MIYLDHAAATPVSPKALSAMLPYFSEEFFNPSAPYLPAKHVRSAYEEAKDIIAHTIGAKGVDLVITSGATESINLTFTAIPPSAKLLTLSTEHAAVLETASHYHHDLIQVDHYGLTDFADFRQKLTDDVALVSISLANNELGTIQPLAEVSELLRAVRQDRLQRGITRPLLLHSDASQALNLLDLNVSRLGIDLLTLNAAKCGGPKGVGALYVGHGVHLSPITFGGGQERGLRSGTENVPGVIGFAAALQDAKTHLASARENYQNMASVLRRELAHTSIVAHMEQIVKHNLDPEQRNYISGQPDYIPEIPAPLFLGNPKHQLANFIPVSFPGLDAERLIYKLEQQGILVSTGAACAANKGAKSHVLTAIGLSDAEITGSLRLSLGSTNTLSQIEQAAQEIATTVAAEYLRTFGRDRFLDGSQVKPQNPPRKENHNV